jgi:transposase-like protein
MCRLRRGIVPTHLARRGDRAGADVAAASVGAERADGPDRRSRSAGKAVLRRHRSLDARAEGGCRRGRHPPHSVLGRIRLGPEVYGRLAYFAFNSVVRKAITDVRTIVMGTVKFIMTVMFRRTLLFRFRGSPWGSKPLRLISSSLSRMLRSVRDEDCGSVPLYRGAGPSSCCECSTCRSGSSTPECLREEVRTKHAPKMSNRPALRITSGHDVYMGERWTREEKAAILAAHDAARSGSEKATIRMAFGVSEVIISRWREQLAAGTLTDDEADDSRGGVVLGLARLFRDVITRGNTSERIDSRSLAGRVVFDGEGRWRTDYLARARSALAHVFDVVEVDPDAVLRPNKGVTAAHAVAEVRAYWGVDTFPILVSATRPNNASYSSLETREMAEARANRIRTIAGRGRWSDMVFGSVQAVGGLDSWLRDVPTAREYAPSMAEGQFPVWQRHPPAQWPPPREAAYIAAVLRNHLGQLDELAELGEERHLRVLRRRTVTLITDYTRSVEDWASLLGYLKVCVIRPWLPATLPPYEDDDEGDVSWTSQPQLASAAITALCLYRAIHEWDQTAMRAAVAAEHRHLSEAAGTDSGSTRRAAEIVAVPKRQPITTPALPEFVTLAMQSAQELFVRAQQVAQAKHPLFVGRYLAWREQLNPKLMPPVSRRVVVLADYIAGLNASGREIRTGLDSDTRQRLRAALELSAMADGNAYGSANARNDALEAQSIAPEHALDLAWDGLHALSGGVGDSRISARQIHEMRQQFYLVMAGTSMQIVEQCLSLTSAELTRMREEGRYPGLVEHAHRRADDACRFSKEAVDLITTLSNDTEAMHRARYSDGHLAHESFVFTAYLYAYRAACAGATAKAVFGFKSDIDFDSLLVPAHEKLATAPDTFPNPSLARAIQAMLWHAFLNERRLPPLPEHANPVLARIDPIARTNGTGRLLDPQRLTDLTKKLVEDIGWNAGALGGFPAGSPTWRHLDWTSSGAYSRWREEWGPRVAPSGDG